MSLPVWLSVVAIVLAVLTFWNNYLSPFKPQVLFGTPQFRLYKIPDVSCMGEINDDSDGWTISIDATVSVANAGARSGCVQDFRIVLESRETGEAYTEKLNATWIIDEAKFVQSDISDNRDRMLASTISHWSAHLILPKTILSRQIVFQSHERWLESDLDKTLGFCVYCEANFGHGWNRIEGFPFVLPAELVPKVMKGASLLMSKDKEL